MKIYIVTFLIFIGIDLLWLGVVAKNFYFNQIGFIMRSSPNWSAALAFYALFVFGLVYFVVNPALEKSSFKYALVSGLLFGLITYSTYDLTNLATLKDWPIYVTIVDLVWGTALGGIVSSLSYLVMGKL